MNCPVQTVQFAIEIHFGKTNSVSPERANFLDSSRLLCYKNDRFHRLSEVARPLSRLLSCVNSIIWFDCVDEKLLHGFWLSA
jgi:hypothetical protein